MSWTVLVWLMLLIVAFSCEHGTLHKKKSIVSLTSWVGLGTGQDGCREEKISRLHWGSNPELPSP